MTQYILFDTEVHHHLLPFTHTRPVADLWCGSFTMRERIENLLGIETSTLTLPYLQEVFPIHLGDSNIYINGALTMTQSIADAIKQLGENEAIIWQEHIIAYHTTQQISSYEDLKKLAEQATTIEWPNELTLLRNVWDIFSLNPQLQQQDFHFITQNKTKQALNCTAAHEEQIFVEEGAKIGLGVILNAQDGPIFIESGAEIMDGAIIRGPFTLRKGAVVKMAAKIYPGTTVGLGSKVGGEIGNTVFFSNSNKGHDGYLGNSVIGEWCNLGADTNSSNLKNNYDNVKIWHEYNNKSINTGLQFCGLLMGDHSKCGINTMFNTGTVVGVSANVYGAGFPEKFIPSFAWGGSEGMTTYQLHKAMETANRMMARRHQSLSEAELKMYQYIFDLSAPQRAIFANNY